MADASSSDTTSDCCAECFSDITSERPEYVIVGQKPCPSHRRSKRNLLQKLYIREIRGCLAPHNYASEERLFASVPSWRRLPLLRVFPKSAMEAGHIVMGLTQCGQFLLTYTFTLEMNGTTSLYKYLLHWWAFTPNRVARKVAEVTLFGNYTINRELSIVISQWPMEKNKLVIHGLCSNWMYLQPTDRAYLTITTVPSLDNCKDCLKVAASYEEEGEELAANWDGCVRCNCLQHGLTVHTTYEVISPYPKFRVTVCLKYWNHVVVNTGNFLHVLRVDLDIPKGKSARSSEKVVPDTVSLDMSDVEEMDYTKCVRDESSDEKVESPRCDSTAEADFLDEALKLDKLSRDLSANPSGTNQSDGVCDTSKPSDGKWCECQEACECKWRTEQAISVRDKIIQDFCEDMSQELPTLASESITLVKHPSCSPRSTPQRLPPDLRTLTWSSPPSDILSTRNSESSQISVESSQRSSSPQPGVSQENGIASISSSMHTVSVSPSSSTRLASHSVRDKIIEDFCEDMSQDLNIGSDSITLVKHPSCSPRSTPQRLPPDLRTLTWSSPPSDILRTRNSESSQNSVKSSQRSSSPQPGVSQDNGIASISSSMRTVSVSPSSSTRLMSPPITRSFRHPSPRKRSNLHSPPPIISSAQPRTRASHKLILEAEKAYEFTDDAQETCEKLSSFRKRRLADKKYEFTDEAQETCEKLSSFRKRRLADKKYEFCDETEDAENIVPFKHIRDQFRHRGCSIHQISSSRPAPASPTMSPGLPNGWKYWTDSDQSETDDFNVSQEIGLSNDLNTDSAQKNVLRPLNQNQLSNGTQRDRLGKPCQISSPLVPKINLQYPMIKCTAHFKRSYIELDDEMISVITDVEDEETGGYVSYQCVLPMHVHGSGYVQMQMISNAQAEKLSVPCVSISQLSFDIDTFSHHIADWICARFKKKYWHCSDYDIEIIDVCALSGDIICLLIMQIQASEICNQTQCSQERKLFEVGCKFTWNIDTSEYRITDVLPLEDVKLDSWKPNFSDVPHLRSPLWNPTRHLAPKLREKIQQPYALVRYLHNEMTLAGESIARLYDLDNLVEFYITPQPSYSSIE